VLAPCGKAGTLYLRQVDTRRLQLRVKRDALLTAGGNAALATAGKAGTLYLRQVDTLRLQLRVKRGRFTYGRWGRGACKLRVKRDASYGR
jgi:hypothetical protein